VTDIKIKIIDREGVAHEVDAPTDMNMNLMEVVRYDRRFRWSRSTVGT